jgi:hypothetical protein
MMTTYQSGRMTTCAIGNAPYQAEAVAHCQGPFLSPMMPWVKFPAPQKKKKKKKKEHDIKKQYWALLLVACLKWCHLKRTLV